MSEFAVANETERSEVWEVSPYSQEVLIDGDEHYLFEVKTPTSSAGFYRLVCLCYSRNEAEEIVRNHNRLHENRDEKVKDIFLEYDRAFFWFLPRRWSDWLTSRRLKKFLLR